MVPLLKSTAYAMTPGMMKKIRPIPSRIATPTSMGPWVCPLRSGCMRVPQAAACRTKTALKSGLDALLMCWFMRNILGHFDPRKLNEMVESVGHGKEHPQGIGRD